MNHQLNPANDAVRRLAAIARRVGGSLALDETLDAVAHAVVEALGFRAAVVNLVTADGELHVVAVAGCEEVRQALRGSHSPRAAWDAMMAAATTWGDLRFLRHGTVLPDAADGMRVYVPPLPVPDDEHGGRWHPEDALFAPMRSADGELVGVLSVDDPVDGMLPDADQRALLEAFVVQAALAIERARVHQSVRTSEELLGRLFDESPVGKALFGPDRRYVRVNRAYCEFLGREPDELLGADVVDFCHPEERERTMSLSREAREEGHRAVRVECRYRHADGHDIWGRLSLTPIAERDGVSVLAAVEDITEARAAEEQLRHLALHDSLTGLPNRTLIFDRLEQAMARCRRGGGAVGVIVVDVDHFKEVNDNYGHPAGDQLLAAVVNSLNDALRDTDTAGRLGGDEFVVVCENVRGPAEVSEIAERLRAAARTPVQIGTTTLLPSISLGCTVTTGDNTVDDVISEADAALYRAKAAGRGRHELFDEEMRRNSHAQLELRAQLERALDNDELVLHYQPIVELAGGRVLGYEALLRWQHPQRGLLLPAEFLSVITDGDLDVPVTQWVLRRACQDIAALDRAGDSADGGDDADAPYLSVNLSPRQLCRPELEYDVALGGGEAGLPTSRLWLEITEEHLVDRRHRPTLDALQALGCRLALDDFGTGYSGLTYLQQLSVNAIKIDRSYIARICNDRVSAGITAAVTGLAEVIGIRVVAEGVETEEQAQQLATMGVSVAQGFLFGRPAPLSEPAPTTAGVPQQRRTDAGERSGAINPW
jgi:diguanylate cyclase (GGDEF)-like protein/PAS domain S-box-containing protein